MATGPKRNLLAFIEPPQGDVIEKILRHCGMWESSSPRAPPGEDGWPHKPDVDWDGQEPFADEPQELTYVDIDTFEATF